MNILHVTSSPRGSASYSNRVAGQRDRRTHARAIRAQRSRCATSRAIRCRISTTTSSPRPARPNGPQTERAARAARAVRRAGRRAARRRRGGDRGADDQLHHSVDPEDLDRLRGARRAHLQLQREGAEGPRHRQAGDPRGGARRRLCRTTPALDFQVPYLKGVLGFLGMTDVEVIEVEGTAFGPEAAEKAVEAATAKLHAQLRRARRGGRVTSNRTRGEERCDSATTN